MIQLIPDAPQRYLLTLKDGLLCYWSPRAPITTGPLSLFTEREESAAAGEKVCVSGGGGGGGDGGGGGGVQG